MYCQRRFVVLLDIRSAVVSFIGRFRKKFRIGLKLNFFRSRLKLSQVVTLSVAFRKIFKRFKQNLKQIKIGFALYFSEKLSSRSIVEIAISDFFVSTQCLKIFWLRGADKLPCLRM
jgi:hypothetical protein